MSDFNRSVIYDIESFPNVFILVMQRVDNGEVETYECSARRNDFEILCFTLHKLKNLFWNMVGFNNTFYDYPVLHHLLTSLTDDPTGLDVAEAAYKKTTEIIINTPFDEKWTHVIYDDNQFVPQIDLFRIHHFDNVSRSTSLKMLEFNMRLDSIQELPYTPGSHLEFSQIDPLIQYCKYDVETTTRFFNETKEKLEFRQELSKRYARNFINHNDTKIGKDYFLMRLKESGIDCYDYISGRGRKPRQTKRPDGIDLPDILLPLIHFDRPEFQAVYDWISRQKIKQTKSVFTKLPFDNLGSLEQYTNLKKVKGAVKNLNCIVDGFQFDFGTGGIHGSINSTIEYEDPNWAIIDIDVTSYYPSIAIAHTLYPAHLGQGFVEIYEQVKKERMSYPKKSAINEMLKLALNGVYGDSNNKFSPFYDPAYTMSITINGQLMLAMLAENLLSIKGLSLLQINTDGLTVRVKRSDLDVMTKKCEQWEHITGMNLEQVEYARLFIRDVNNYIGEMSDGKLKVKGAYVHDRTDPIQGLGWHQNHSMLVVPMAAVASLTKGVSVEDFIRNHEDPLDFMMRTKVPRSSKLMIDNGSHIVKLQNITRYYVSTIGGTLDKIMPPLKGKDTERHIAINKGFWVTPMNVLGEVKNINYDFYIGEAKKLIDPLISGVVGELSQ